MVDRSAEDSNAGGQSPNRDCAFDRGQVATASEWVNALPFEFSHDELRPSTTAQSESRTVVDGGQFLPTTTQRFTEQPTGDGVLGYEDIATDSGVSSYGSSERRGAQSESESDDIDGGFSATTPPSDASIDDDIDEWAEQEPDKSPIKAIVDGSFGDARNRGSQMTIRSINQPEDNQLPGYISESSHGHIRGRNNQPVTFCIQNSTKQSKAAPCLIIFVAVTQNIDGDVLLPHSHFCAAPIADRKTRKVEIDGLHFLAYRESLSLTGGEMTIKLDKVGLRQIGERKVSKPDRKCRILCRAYMLLQCPHSGSWVVVDSCQSRTEAMTCDRPKGPPTIEDMTSRESFFEGGGQCTVKGKNLKGKEPTKVSVYSESGWSSDAHVNGRFTSKECVVFIVPPLPAEHQVQSAVKCQLRISVDGQDGKPEEFTYNRLKNEVGTIHVPMECDPTPLPDLRHNAADWLADLYGTSFDTTLSDYPSAPISQPVTIPQHQSNGATMWQQAGAVNRYGYVDHSTPPRYGGSLPYGWIGENIE